MHHPILTIIDDLTKCDELSVLYIQKHMENKASAAEGGGYLLAKEDQQALLEAVIDIISNVKIIENEFRQAKQNLYLNRQKTVWQIGLSVAASLLPMLYMAGKLTMDGLLVPDKSNSTVVDDPDKNVKFIFQKAYFFTAISGLILQNRYMEKLKSCCRYLRM